MPYRKRFNRKLRVRRKSHKGQRLHFRIKISPGDLFSHNSAYTFPFLVHFNPRRSDESFINYGYNVYNGCADGYNVPDQLEADDRFRRYRAALNCLTGVGLLNFHPFDQNRNMNFNPIKALRDTYGKMRVNKIVYQYKPIYYDFAKRPMFSRQYSRPVTIGSNTTKPFNQDGEYNFIENEFGLPPWLLVRFPIYLF